MSLLEKYPWLMLVLAAAIWFLFASLIFGHNHKPQPPHHKENPKVRIIYVLERKDKQPFDFPTTPVKVVGVGFASGKDAEAILQLMQLKNDFVIQELLEGPMAPIGLPPTPPAQA